MKKFCKQNRQHLCIKAMSGCMKSTGYGTVHMSWDLEKKCFVDGQFNMQLPWCTFLHTLGNNKGT